MTNHLVLTVSVMLGLTFEANAIPTLQLDASPATYDKSSSSTETTASSFTLYALLNSLSAPAGYTFDIVAAIQPEQGTPANLGSFAFNGTTVPVTSGMTYGVPSGLPTHGVYPTYYKLFQFDFSGGTKFTDYDVSLLPGIHSGPTANSSGNGLFTSFKVDVSGLAAGHTLWFDLVEYDQNGNYVDKAPFSHAAFTGGSSVPDHGATAVLLGAACLGVGLCRRRLCR
jgi:hypothetical protein